MTETSSNVGSQLTLVQRWLRINPLDRSKVYAQISLRIGPSRSLVKVAEELGKSR